jgi:serine/threonine protein kinase
VRWICTYLYSNKSNALEKRYSSISNRLKNLRSQYFVDFEFQQQGVRVASKLYPVVKMAWATGTTLGQFLEQHYRSATNIQQLGASLKVLSKYLESQNIAHGDIQPGNVMIADSGKKIQLIDYDGIFVEDIKSLGSAELGHRNFQHPKRSSTTWDSSLDRFSFIALDLALRALQVHPELWTKMQSDGDSILFKANDFADPSNSKIFAELFGKPAFSEDAKNFAAICKSSYDKIPTLEDFIAKRNIPQVVITFASTKAAATAQYLSAFTVLDAKHYATCLRYVGDKIELIGQIVEVKEDKTRRGKPYLFINFGPWQGEIVKVSIWSEGLDALTNKPSQSWIGKWISVVGLLEPPYISSRYKYSHLAISITQGSQLHIITAQEAKFRLSGSATRSGSTSLQSSNTDILEGIRGGTPTSSRGVSPGRQIPQVSSNEAILKAMKGSQPSSQATSRSSGSYSAPVRSSSKPTSSSNCFVATAIYGFDAPQTNLLRRWRDKRLLSSALGRLLVTTYYKISPRIIPYLDRNPLLQMFVRRVLDRVVRAIEEKK